MHQKSMMKFKLLHKSILSNNLSLADKISISNSLYKLYSDERQIKSCNRNELSLPVIIKNKLENYKN